MVYTIPPLSCSQDHVTPNDERLKGGEGEGEGVVRTIYEVNSSCFGRTSSFTYARERREGKGGGRGGGGGGGGGCEGRCGMEF